MGACVQIDRVAAEQLRAFSAEHIGRATVHAVQCQVVLPAIIDCGSCGQPEVKIAELKNQDRCLAA